LGELIAKACLLAWDIEPMAMGRVVMREIKKSLGERSLSAKDSLVVGAS
jgi:hypothetical protein